MKLGGIKRIHSLLVEYLPVKNHKANNIFHTSIFKRISSRRITLALSIS